MKKITREFLSIEILFLLITVSEIAHAQIAVPGCALWLKVYGSPGAMATMTFGNRLENTTSGIDSAISFPPEYREQAAPPSAVGFEVVWGSVRGASQFGLGVRGLLDRQFNALSGGPAQKDTFRINFSQGDNSNQDISFKWMDPVNISLRCDSLVMVYFDPILGVNVRLNMSTTDTLVIPAAGANGVGFIRIFKYGILMDCTGGVDEEQVPNDFYLAQNFPNPFNPETRIQYAVESRKFVSLKVYDVLGREVATLVDGIQDAGFKTVRWDAPGVTSGVYFYRLRAGMFGQTKKMILIR